MPRWRVRDVMTTEVITMPYDAPFAEIAAGLARHRISAVAIIDRFHTVVGVVSWTDLIDKIDTDEPDGSTRRGWVEPSAVPALRWRDGTAVQVVSAPAVTIRPDASLPAAARVMYRKGIGRLLVTDQKDRLRGIVTRADLLKVDARLDRVIRGDGTEWAAGRGFDGDIVDEWGRQSFPASDPPSNW